MAQASARPAAMAAYTAGLDGSYDAARRALRDLEDALDALHGALAPDGAVPVRSLPEAKLGRARALDATVAEVGEGFRRADASGQLVTADSSAVGPVPGEAFPVWHRERIAAEAADELATLAEDDADPTSRAELAGYLDLLRSEVEASAAGLAGGAALAARRARAAELLGPMGGGDLAVALDIVGDGILAGGRGRERALGTADDLGVVASLALEGDPSRARRWADVVAAGTTEGTSYDGDELLAVLAAHLDPAATTLGAAGFWAAMAEVEGQSRFREPSGLVAEAFGAGTAEEVLLRAVADRPPLANRIVREGFAGEVPGTETWPSLLASLEVLGSRPRVPQGDETLAAALTAATHASLPEADRTDAALGLLDWATQVGASRGRSSAWEGDRPLNGVAPALAPALGAALDVALEGLLRGGSGVVALPGAPNEVPGGAATVEAFLSEARQHPVVGHALTRSVLRLTREQLHEVVAAGEGDGGLSQLGGLLRWLVDDAASDQYRALVDSVEGGGGDAALASVLQSALGAAPDGGVSAAVYSAILAHQGQDTGRAGAVLPDEYSTLIRVELLMAHLEAGHVEPTPELRDGLADAARAVGPQGVLTYLRGTPELAEVERLVEEQAGRVDAGRVGTVDRIFSTG